MKKKDAKAKGSSSSSSKEKQMAKKKAIDIVNKALKLNSKSHNSTSKHQVLALLDEALAVYPDLLDALYNKAIVLLELYEINTSDDSSHVNATDNHNNAKAIDTNASDSQLFEFSNTKNIDVILLDESYSLLLLVIRLDTSKRSETLGLTYRALSLMILQHYNNLDQYKHHANTTTSTSTNFYYYAINDSIKHFTTAVSILTNDKHLDEMILEYSQEILESFNIYYNTNKITITTDIDQLILLVDQVLVLMDQALQTNISNDVDSSIFSTKANIFIVVLDSILSSTCDSSSYSNSIRLLYDKALVVANTMLQLGNTITIIINVMLILILIHQDKVLILIWYH